MRRDLILNFKPQQNPKSQGSVMNSSPLPTRTWVDNYWLKLTLCSCFLNMLHKLTKTSSCLHSFTNNPNEIRSNHSGMATLLLALPAAVLGSLQAAEPGCHQYTLPLFRESLLQFRHLHPCTCYPLCSPIGPPPGACLTIVIIVLDSAHCY